MKKIEKILVPLAFSPYSEGIVQYAVMLANSLNVQQLIFVSVINQRDVDAVETITSFGYEVDGVHYVQEIKKTRVAELDNMLKEIGFPEEKMKLIITVGKPADKLLKYAVQENVDMIVMGVKAKSDIVQAFTGSVAEKSFRRSPITIVSYREESIADKLRKRITDKL
ncbi:MAG: universal stress protein [Desulfobulbaceae bacterium]|nr:universal stress protein [Desulfobulbaceae bacterium]